MDDLSAQVAAVARRFAEEKIAPRVDALEQGRELPFPLIAEMTRALGIGELAEAALSSPGQGESGSVRDVGLAAALMRELSRVLPGFALSFGASLGLCAQGILHRGTAEQKRRYALPVLKGEKIGAWALTEPGAGSDAFGLTTTATAEGDRWRLTGQKTFITNAPYADVFVIYARAGDDVAPFVLERSEGLTTSAPFGKMGHRCSPTGAIFLDGARAEALGGEVRSGGGRRGAVESLMAERAALCAMGVGIMERALEIAVAYARERQQFGQPIASFQAVQIRLARMYAAVEVGRALLDRCIEKSRAGDKDLAYFCAAKLTVAELATKVALEAVQVLGGNGYMTEYRVEMLARDAKLLEIGGGTGDIQCLTIARELLKS